jgi:PqqD family protein of HPr-rel-A system
MPAGFAGIPESTYVRIQGPQYHKYMKPDLSNARPTAAQNVTAADFEGEVVAYSPASTKGYHLNATAAWVWKHCDGKHNVDELAALMREEFDCEKADVRSDINKTLGELLASGLIEFDSPPRMDA